MYNLFSFCLLPFRYFGIIFFLVLGACQTSEDKNTTEEKPPKIQVHKVVDTLSVDLKTKAIIQSLDYDTSKWTDVAVLIPDIKLDMRYATTNNFVKEQLYNCGRCFLRPEAAKALSKAQKELQKKGLGFKMFDCFRPRPIQQKLWDIMPNASYVTPPSRGSMHNKGLAVDLTIVDSKGKELDMGTDFDFFGKKGHHDYTNLPEEVLNNRLLLKETLKKYGFKHIRTEWWHYSYILKSHRLSDMIWECE